MFERKSEFSNYFTYIYLEKEDLEKFSTRELIAMVHCTNNKRCNAHDGWVEFDWDDWYSKFFYEKDIREILSTRPHIPNREERKQIILANRKRTKKILKYKNK